MDVAGLGICQFCEYTAHREGLIAIQWTGTAIFPFTILTDCIVHGSFGWILSVATQPPLVNGYLTCLKGTEGANLLNSRQEIDSFKNSRQPIGKANIIRSCPT